MTEQRNDRNDRNGHGDSQMGNIIPNSVLFNRKSNFRKGSKCPLADKKISYKDIELLSQYISEKGRILPSRIGNVSAKKQRELKRAINVARNLALLPFTVI